MKRIVSLCLASVMLVVMVLSLASCSVYGTIESNFVNAGYKVIDPESTEGKTATAFTSIFGDEENGEVSVTLHILKKAVGSYAFVLEFGADAAAQEKLSEYMTEADIENYMQIDDESKLLRGNCVLIPFSLNSDTRAEMIELFNK